MTEEDGPAGGMTWPSDGDDSQGDPEGTPYDWYRRAASLLDGGQRRRGRHPARSPARGRPDLDGSARDPCSRALRQQALSGGGRRVHRACRAEPGRGLRPLRPGHVAVAAAAVPARA